eukprot:4825714-Pleurochrysis_carterae.AAC.3
MKSCLHQTTRAREDGHATRAESRARAEREKVASGGSRHTGQRFDVATARRTSTASPRCTRATSCPSSSRRCRCARWCRIWSARSPSSASSSLALSLTWSSSWSSSSSVSS